MEAGHGVHPNPHSKRGLTIRTGAVRNLPILFAITFLLFLIYFGSSEPSTHDGSHRVNSDSHTDRTIPNLVDQSAKSPRSDYLGGVNPESLAPITWKCTEEERRKQIDAFLQMPTRWHGCVEPTHLYSFLPFLWPLTQQPITLVNIGANKGYNLVTWWESWLPQSGINPGSWGRHLKSLYPTVFDEFKFCGTCGDCYEHSINFVHHDSVKNESYPNPLRIIGIEPSTSNFDMLLQLKEWSNNPVLEVYNYAASNESGEAKFPITRIGLTTGSLMDIKYASANPNNTFKSTRVVTVDELVSELSISKIDYLLIDAEGYDPLIVKGAYKSLSSGKISMLEFEYHGIGPWYTTKLKDVVEFLGNFQYDCYLKAPERRLVKLTDCFGDEYETHEWSNVMCVHRSHSLVNAFLLSHAHFLFHDGP